MDSKGVSDKPVNILFCIFITLFQWKLFDFGPEKSKSRSDPQDNDVLLENNLKQIVGPSFKQDHVKKKAMSSFNFYESLVPKSVKELAVHPKKIQEVEHWLKFNVLSSPKVFRGLLFSLTLHSTDG